MQLKPRQQSRQGLSATAGLLAVLAILLTSCGPSPDEEARSARLLVEAFLTDASARSDGRGWEHLSPTTLSALFSGDLHAYARQADAAAWDGFEWEVIKVERDAGFYQVVIGHTGTLPEFVSALTSYKDGRLTGGPTFMVRFQGLNGPPGIYESSRESE